jgi:hypothetical protein
VVEKGGVDTTALDLGALVSRLSKAEELLAGQEVGTMTHFVHDTKRARPGRNVTRTSRRLIS